jgi:hypothetical protein
MAPDQRYEIKETSIYTFEVFAREATGRQWIGSFRFFKDALDFTKLKMLSRIPQESEHG